MTYSTTHSVRIVALMFFFTIAFVLFVPASTHAYLTTAQDVQTLDHHGALFTIDYSFGQEKHDVIMPVFAHRGSAANSSSVSFEIVDENGKVVAGKTAGIVFSTASLQRNATYLVKKGTSNSFRLAVVFLPTENTTGHTYRLQVTSLPFNFDGTQQLSLNPSELQYYTTKLLSL